MCWAYYFMSVNEKDPMKSSVWASFLMLFGAFTTVSYLNDRTLIIAAVIGAFIGTYLTVKFHNKKQDGNT